MAKPTSEEKFDYVRKAIMVCNRALTEMKHILPESDKDPRYLILNNQPFTFYRESLYYVFNAEYNKLLDSNQGKEGEYIASLSKLNNLLNTKDNKFRKEHDRNIIELEKLKKSDFSKKRRKDRNTVFSHSAYTGKLKYNPEHLFENEIEEGFTNLRVMLRIFNNIRGHISDGGVTLIGIPEEGGLTPRFIRNHLKFKKFYEKNKQTK